MGEVELSDEGAVRTIRMNRPAKKNALNLAMYRAMSEALLEVGTSADIRVAVILGLPGAFCAGNDIGDFLAMAGEARPPAEIRDFLHALATAEKPVVAGVDGLAIGIGTTMLMHCDLAYATPGSVFRTPFLDLGITPEAASSLLAPRLMGHQKAFALLAMGESLNAEESREAGLVHRVSEDAEEAALDAARRLAGKPQKALAIARRLLRGDPDEVLRRIDLEIDHFGERLQSVEAREAFQTFLARKQG